MGIENCNYCGSSLWMFTTIACSLGTITGNVLTLCAILLSKKLSSVLANYFIFSLAVSDLMVGLFIPYHMLFYTVEGFGKMKFSCLLRFVLTSLACSSSICNLLFIAMDRYIAIVYPLHYTRFMVKKTVFSLITVGWIVALGAALVPFIWNQWTEGVACEIVNVLPYNYIQYILIPMFSLIWMTMLVLYVRICYEASGQQKKIVSGNVHLPKSFQVTLMILGCFTLCWLPYFVIVLYIRTTRNSESAALYEVFFTSAMANSCMNPLIYAWKNTNFRKGFLNLLKCRHPDDDNCDFVTNHVPSKRNSMNGVWSVNCQREELTTGTEMSTHDDRTEN